MSSRGGSGVGRIRFVRSRPLHDLLFFAGARPEENAERAFHACPFPRQYIPLAFKLTSRFLPLPLPLSFPIPLILSALRFDRKKGDQRLKVFDKRARVLRGRGGGERSWGVVGERASLSLPPPSFFRLRACERAGSASREGGRGKERRKSGRGRARRGENKGDLKRVRGRG